MRTVLQALPAHNEQSLDDPCDQKIRSDPSDIAALDYGRDEYFVAADEHVHRLSATGVMLAEHGGLLYPNHVAGDRTRSHGLRLPRREGCHLPSVSGSRCED
jgi:hypothetical protein